MVLDKLYEKERLRGLIYEMPVKAILAFLFVYLGTYSKGFEFSDVFFIVFMYSVMTYIFAITKVVRNWLIGSVLFLIIILGTAWLEMPKWLDLIYGIILFGGGVLLDVSRLYKFIKLSIQSKRKNREYRIVDEAVEENINVIQNNSFNPFAGCDTEEKLDKRYSELSKSFHPDMQGGDNQSMQYINAEYERLLKKFQNT